jgi:CO/xanthine dehydrogenase FAD-binding subunit
VDLNAVTGYAPAPAATWRDGDAWLGGGSWLFSQPQPRLRRLLDLHAFGWPPLTETDDGLSIAATCTLAQLARWRPARPSHAPAAELARQCCDALLGSFKVQNVATVGGNICLSLPAGPMTSLTAALDGVAAISRPDGRRRRLAVADLVTGDGANALAPGELLTRVDLPAAALTARTAFRQVSLSAVGRSAVLVIARRPARDQNTSGGGVSVDGFGVSVAPMTETPNPSDDIVITVTASVPRPLQLRFAALPDPAEAVAALDAADPPYLDDVHGSARWRAAMTRRSVAAVTAELAAEPGPAGPGPGR